MTKTHEPLAYTVPQFCAVAGIAKSKLYLEAAAGRIRIAKCGKRSLILSDEARRFLADLPPLKQNRAA